MKSSGKPLASLHPARRPWLAPNSLQFRLTAGITIASALGLGGVAAWINWTMQKLLVTNYIAQVDYIANRFPEDVSLYREILGTKPSVQRSIDRSASPSLLIWVRTSDRVFAESVSLKTASPDFQASLMNLAKMPLQAQIYLIDGRSVVISSSSLIVDREAVGQLYIARDVTEEQRILAAAGRQVGFATIAAIGLLMLVIWLYVRRSLQPLRKMSQLAETISADDLKQARLYLDHAPDEVRELARMLDAMLLRISESLEQQRQFASNLSHELRTPLSIVSGYLQSLLRRRSNLSSSQTEALEIAAAETDRTIQLLQQLLDLARADSGHLHFHQEEVCLTDLIHEIVELSRSHSDHPIEVEVVPNLYIKTDRSRLTQALLNLIDNAVKYSKPQEPIIIKLTQTEAQTMIQVIDSGCGIPLVQQSRIFERFYRIDQARDRATGGVGLGLAIVKSLIEGMGGQVKVWSKPDEGSVFTVTLPNL
jgi:signal transduction histidine kinase